MSDCLGLPQVVFERTGAVGRKYTKHSEYSTQGNLGKCFRDADELNLKRCTKLAEHPKVGKTSGKVLQKERTTCARTGAGSRPGWLWLLRGRGAQGKG